MANSFGVQAAPYWTQERQPIVLVGPTATGKTDAALALAEALNGEIVNADSVQVYRGLDIGSAKPDRDTRARVPFHLLDVVHPNQQYTVADWKAGAEAAMEDILRRDKIPIVCGGTGLYIRALLDNWSLAATPADPEVRQALETQRRAQGISALYARLQEADPDTATRLHPNDAVRIIRALEVFAVTGTPLSVYQAEDRRTHASRPARRFGLMLPRDVLYARIDRRVDVMLQAGWIEEVRGLLAQGYAPETSALDSLGYREIAAFLTGKMEYADCVEAIKQNTRRYAKRQFTWFRADKQLHWIEAADKSAAEVSAIIADLFLFPDTFFNGEEIEHE